MRQDRFYYPNIDDLLITDKNLINKIKNVLRRRVGDEFIVFDGVGKEYNVCIEELSKKAVKLQLLDIVASSEKSSAELHLAFAMIKAQKVDLILQKCTELGVDQFHPFVSEFSNIKEPGKAKVQHFEHVIDEACAQCRRLWLPRLNTVTDTSSIVAKFDDYDLLILADPYETISRIELQQKIAGLQKAKVLFLVGPEGGFSPKELELFSSHKNIVKYKFSNFVLRAETAAIVLSAEIANMIDKKS